MENNDQSLFYLAGQELAPGQKSLTSSYSGWTQGTEASQPQDIEDADFQAGIRLKLAFLALMVLTFMVAMNSTALAVALPTIAEELSGTALEAFWAGTSFLLTEAIFMAPLGRLSDTMGRIYVLNLSTVLFLIGTIVTSASTNFGVLIFGRSVQGAGGGGVVVLLEVVVTDLVPLSVRGNYFSIISAIWVLGDISGPILGGLLASRSTWRWIFWANIPVAIIGLLLTNLFIRLHGIPGTFQDKLKRVDWGGIAISVIALTNLLVGVTWGGVLYSWDSVPTILPIVIGLTGIFMFFIYEKFKAKEPMIRFDLLVNYNILYALFTAFFHTIVFLGLIYILPLYLEAVLGFEPLHAALAIIPYGIAVAPFSALAGIIISKTGGIHWVIRAGYAIIISGTGMLLLLDTKTNLLIFEIVLVWTGAGLGLLYNALVLLAQAAMEEEHAAFAVTILNFFRHLGQAVGVAVVGVIFQNQMRDKLLSDPQLASFADTFSRDAAALVQELAEMQEADFKTSIISAYSNSLKAIWIALCALSILPFIGSFFLKKVDLNRAHETAQGLKCAKQRTRTDSKAVIETLELVE